MFSKMNTNLDEWAVFRYLVSTCFRESLVFAIDIWCCKTVKKTAIGLLIGKRNQLPIKKATL